MKRLLVGMTTALMMIGSTSVFAQESKFNCDISECNEHSICKDEILYSNINFDDLEKENLRKQIILMSVSDSETGYDVVTSDYFKTLNDYNKKMIYAICNHIGTERTVKFAGQCFSDGGWVYSVTCKPCGSFIGGLCTTANCRYW